MSNSLLNNAVDIATIVGAFGTIFFGYATYQLSKKTNHLQDVVAAASSFPGGSFSICRIFPLQGFSCVMAAVHKYISNFVPEQDIKAWTQANYLLALESEETWPLHIAITKVKRVSFTINENEIVFPIDRFLIGLNQAGYPVLLILLKQFTMDLRTEPVTAENLIIQKKIDNNITDMGAFCMYRVYPENKFEYATLHIQTIVENLFLPEGNGFHIQMDLQLQNLDTQPTSESECGYIPDLKVINRHICRY